MGVFVEIVSANVDTRSGRNENGPWMSRTQEAFCHQGGAYPTPFTLRLDETQAAFQPGKYVFGKCYRLGKYGIELNAREIDLVPLDAAIKAYQAVAGARPVSAAA